jgi:tetratricopeptide (TPR) repeat protein
MKQRRLITAEIGLLITIVIGLLGVVSLSRLIDAHRPAPDTAVEEEKLYVAAAVVNRISLGFKGLVADWYWMRSLQYVGRRVLGISENIQIDNLGQLDLKLLAPLLDAATTLDPEFLEPYQYAAVVLPGVDVNEAIRITRKGIAANPKSWRLYQHLGYIYWQQKDFKAAADAYGAGAKLPGVPPWMEAMKARMDSEGGSRDTARQIYRQMYEDASDGQVREMARRRLMQVDAMDEKDVLRQLMVSYKARGGQCPSTWRDMEVILRGLRIQVDTSGAPLDPAGTPYILVKDKCDVEVDWKSQVPFK